MKCPFCAGQKQDNPNMDKPSDHLIITIKNNHTHVHGPFSNELVIRTMIKSLIAEAEKNGIAFQMPTENRQGS